MAYMKDSTGKRLDTFAVAPLGGAAATLDPAWAPFTVHPDATNPGFYLIGNS